MHLMVIALVVLVLYGPDRLPELMTKAGRAYAQGRTWYTSMTSEVRDSLGVDLGSGPAQFFATEPPAALDPPPPEVAHVAAPVADTAPPPSPSPPPTPSPH
jgi:Sec-independent protein translocase protein TatA